MEYAGRHQLWLEPGQDAETGDVTATLVDDVLTWRWTRGEKIHQGALHLDGSRWHDTFHQPVPAALEPQPAFGARFAGGYRYGPDDQPWAWMIRVCDRPTGALVVQMTNITPWGETAPAVEFVLDVAG